MRMGGIGGFDQVHLSHEPPNLDWSGAEELPRSR